MAVRVIVVGGGIAGCAAALELAERGATVAVVDRDQPGTGATGASAGMLAPQYESGGPEQPFWFGLESARLWPDFARRLEALTQWPVGFRTDGMLVANRDSEEEEAAREALKWQREAGLEGEVVSAPAARSFHAGTSQEVPSYTWLPGEAQVDTQRLAVGLADAVRATGGRVRVGNGVREILTRGGRASGAALQDGTRLEADAVVIAAGAWSPLLVGLPRALPVRPVRGQILRLLPDAPSPWPLLCNHEGRYLVPRENGTLLVGSTMEEAGYDDSVTDEGRGILIASALELFPGLQEARVVERWAGLRPLTPDTWPVLGPEPAMDGLFYATGYGRNGILFAPLTARAVADLIMEERSDVEWEPFSVERLEPKRA
jgi:glycine oxidase